MAVRHIWSASHYLTVNKVLFLLLLFGFVFCLFICLYSLIWQINKITEDRENGNKQQQNHHHQQQNAPKSTTKQQNVTTTTLIYILLLNGASDPMEGNPVADQTCGLPECALASSGSWRETNQYNEMLTRSRSSMLMALISRLPSKRLKGQPRHVIDDWFPQDVGRVPWPFRPTARLVHRSRASRYRRLWLLDSRQREDIPFHTIPRQRSPKLWRSRSTPGKKRRRDRRGELPPFP